MAEFIKRFELKLFNKFPLFVLTITESENSPKEDTMEFIETHLNEEDADN